jgi:hypothetical protein
MRQRFTLFPIVAAFVLAGCGGGSIESDLKKSGEELRKDAEKMSDSDLEKKMKDIEAYGDKLDKEAGQEEKKMKLIEVMGIYSSEQMKRKMK